MDPKALLDELLHSCKMLGLVVRAGPMKVPASRLAGGLVQLRGIRMVIVDSSAPFVDRVAAVADAICELEIDPIRLSSDARRAISQARSRRKRATARLHGRRAEAVSLWTATRVLRHGIGPARCRDNAPNSPRPPRCNPNET